MKTPKKPFLITKPSVKQYAKKILFLLFFPTCETAGAQISKNSITTRIWTCKDKQVNKNNIKSKTLHSNGPISLHFNFCSCQTGINSLNHQFSNGSISIGVE